MPRHLFERQVGDPLIDQALLDRIGFPDGEHQLGVLDLPLISSSGSEDDLIARLGVAFWIDEGILVVAHAVNHLESCETLVS